MKAKMLFRDESIFAGWVECETPAGRMRFERGRMRFERVGSSVWRAYVETEGVESASGYLYTRSFRCESERPRPRTLFNASGVK